MTSNIAFMARTCIVGVLVTNKSNMAQYYPEAENFPAPRAIGALRTGEKEKKL